MDKNYNNTHNGEDNESAASNLITRNTVTRVDEDHNDTNNNDNSAIIDNTLLPGAHSVAGVNNRGCKNENSANDANSFVIRGSLSVVQISLVFPEKNPVITTNMQSVPENNNNNMHNGEDNESAASSLGTRNTATRMDEDHNDTNNKENKVINDNTCPGAHSIEGANSQGCENETSAIEEDSIVNGGSLLVEQIMLVFPENQVITANTQSVPTTITI